MATLICRETIMLIMIALSHLADGISISRIEPSYGSSAGGTRVTLFGNDFGRDKYNTEYSVLIGAYPCTVLEYYTSHTQVVCRTGSAQVEVEEAGGDVRLSVALVMKQPGLVHQAAACCFTYSRNLQPYVQRIRPQAGPPGSRLRLTGEPDSFGATTRDVLQVEVGGGLCAFDDGDGDAELPLSQALRSLECQLGDAAGEESVATGSYQVDVRMGGGWHGAPASMRPDVLVYARGGAPFAFQVHPELASVSPAEGSTLGGTHVTITGKGFPRELAAGGALRLHVHVGGLPCTPVRTSSTLLVCSTSSQQAADGSGQAPESSELPMVRDVVVGEEGDEDVALYPGSRGARYRTWAWEVAGYAGRLQEWRKAQAGEAASAYQDTEVVTDLFENPVSNATMGFVGQMDAFFHPPTSGTYTFFFASDDDGDLHGVHAGGSTASMSKIAVVPRRVHYRDWQVSETVQLEAGAAYFLRATHRSEGGVECCTHHLSVGVRVPSGAPMPDSVPEVQVLRTSVERYGQIQTLQALSAPRPSTVQRVVVSWTANDTSTLAFVLQLHSRQASTEPVAVGAPVEVVSAAVDHLVGTTGAVAAITATTGTEQVTFEVTFVPGMRNVPLLSGYVTTLVPSPPPPPYNQSLDVLPSLQLGSVESSYLQEGDSSTQGFFWIFTDPQRMDVGRAVRMDSEAAELGEAVARLAVNATLAATSRAWVAQNGARLEGWRWTLEFAYAQAAAPTIRVASLADDPYGTRTAALTLSRSLVREHSSSLGGSMQLGLGLGTARPLRTVTVPTTTTSHQMKLALESLPEVGKVNVERSVDDNDDVQWHVTFEPVSNPLGNLPLLFVDSAQLTGPQEKDGPGGARR